MCSPAPCNYVQLLFSVTPYHGHQHSDRLMGLYLYVRQQMQMQLEVRSEVVDFVLKGLVKVSGLVGRDADGGLARVTKRCSKVC